MENQKKTTNSLARRMGISLICGLAAGLLLMMLRENLNSSGQEAVWKTINSILFQDITAAGAEKDLGLFYILGQLFILSLIHIYWLTMPIRWNRARSSLLMEKEASMRMACSLSLKSASWTW